MHGSRCFLSGTITPKNRLGYARLFKPGLCGDERLFSLAKPTK